MALSLAGSGKAEGVAVQDHSDMIAELLKEDMALVEELFEEEIKPLTDLGDPEKLLGKKYEQWTQEDIMYLAQIYGPDPNSQLSKLIFDKEFKALKEEEVNA